MSCMSRGRWPSRLVIAAHDPSWHVQWTAARAYLRLVRRSVLRPRGDGSEEEPLLLWLEGVQFDFQYLDALHGAPAAHPERQAGVDAAVAANQAAAAAQLTPSAGAWPGVSSTGPGATALATKSTQASLRRAIVAHALRKADELGGVPLSVAEDLAYVDVDADAGNSWRQL